MSSSSTWVPESFKKKQERDNKEQQALVKSRTERKNRIKASRQDWTNRAQKYYERSIKQRAELVNSLRQVVFI